MFGSAFGFPRLYESPRYCDYYHPGGGGYRGFAQYYNPTCCGYGMPYAEMSPNMNHLYLSPIEIPVIREVARDAKTEKSAVEFIKSCVPEQRGPLKKDTRDSCRPSQKQYQEERNSKPYPVRRMNEMDVLDDEDDESCPFYSGMPLNVFGGGFPFERGNSRSQACTRASHQTCSATAQPKFTDVPVEKASSDDTAAASKSPTAKPSQNYKLQAVPIIMGRMTEDSNNATEEQLQNIKHVPSPMEQLENLKKEIDNIGSRVDNFSGEKNDKEYILLDEIMTALLLKLDTIESNGVEETRNKRRRLVMHVQECVLKLEQKVGILPKDGDMPSIGSVEMTEAVEDDSGENEDHIDTDIVPEEDTILGVARSSHKNEEEPTATTATPLTETAIFSPVQMDITKAVVTNNDLSSAETVSEKLCNVDVESVSENLCNVDVETMESGDGENKTFLSQEVTTTEDITSDVVCPSADQH